MSNVVGEIVIDVTADVGPLMRNMNKAEGAMSGLQGAAGRMGRGLQGAGSMALSFGRNMAVVAAGVAAVTGAAIAFVRSSAAFGDAIGDASKAAGMSTTAFQEYRFALKEAADMTDEDFASAAARLNKTLGDAREGSLGAVKAFEAIGISQAELADASFTTDQAMAAYVATMEGMKDPTLAAAVSADLFGRAGAGMGAALSGVPGQVGSLVDRARELGVVLGPEAVAAAGEFDQKMNDLSASFNTMKTNLAIALMPALNDIVDAITNYVVPALGPDGLGGALQGALELIVIFGEKTVAAFTAFKDGAGAAVDFVVGKFTAFMTMLDTLLAKLSAIGAAISETLGGGGVSAGVASAIQTDSQARLQNDMGPAGFYTNRSSPGVGGAMGGQMLGASIVTGALIGATTAMEENRAAFMSVFSQIPQIARETLGINSPSKVFEEIGGFLGQGLAQGIEASNAMVATAVSAMGDGAVAATNGTVSDILGGLDTLLAGSKKGGAALAWVNTLIGASQEIKKGTFGFASMATVLARGAALVSAIKGGGEGGRGRGSSVTGSASASAAPAQQTTQNLGITFVNDPFGIGERTARAIAARVNEAQRNGARLVVSVA
jgi:hypothetical protein